MRRVGRKKCDIGGGSDKKRDIPRDREIERGVVIESEFKVERRREAERDTEK